MNGQYAEIKAELLMMKEELQSRLFSHSAFYEMSAELGYEGDSSDKEKIILHHVKEDLQDVQLALWKIENGKYGICEETGEEIPLEKLKVLPTARTIYDFTYSYFYQKTAYPQSYNPQLTY